MSCLRTRQMLDAWLDGELDAGTSAGLAQHTESCLDCSAARHGRERLRAALRGLPHFTVPALLRESIVARLHDAPGQSEPGAVAHRNPQVLRWWQALTLAAASSAAAAVITIMVLRGPVGESAPALREPLVTRHVASLASSRLVEVASADRHTVKPWLLGKVDFAPQVRDIAAQGFTLEGARRDQIGDHAAVAVVYKLRAHPINLFVWRGVAADAPDTAPQLSVVRGFSIATWSSGGLRYAAVSDADATEISRFAQALLAMP